MRQDKTSIPSEMNLLILFYMLPAYFSQSSEFYRTILT